MVSFPLWVYNILLLDNIAVPFVGPDTIVIVKESFSSSLSLFSTSKLNVSPSFTEKKSLFATGEAFHLA